MSNRLLNATILVFITAVFTVRADDQRPSEPKLSVMAWNIWHGGCEDGEEVGPQRVVDVVKATNVDIVAMQETYGSGKTISKALGYHLLQRGKNVSIHSRFPIIEDISVFEPSKCIGALIKHPGGERLAVYSIWLPFAAEIWVPNSRESIGIAEMQAACEPSTRDLRKISAAITKRLSAEKYDDVSVFIAGDFNSMSHLDYTAAASEQYEHVIDWKTSHVLIDAGFRDSYRETNPTINRATDSTWSPRFADWEQDRIDFIYYRSNKWQAVRSKVVREHAVKFPSDHAAVVSRFELK